MLRAIFGRIPGAGIVGAVAGFVGWALIGSLVVCVCNLGPKNIAGFTSELLILGAKNAGGQVIVLGPRSEVAVGEPIF